MAMPNHLHIYVPDVDETYRKALDAGATPTREPEDQFYGDRRYGAEDPEGHHWYFAQHMGSVFQE